MQESQHDRRRLVSLAMTIVLLYCLPSTDGLAALYTRKQALLAALGTPLLLASNSDDDDASSSPSPPPPLLQGTVTVDPALLPWHDSSSSSAALYITGRPATADNVPQAILTGTRGKPPPVLATRLANPSFPLDFALTKDDMTVEGAALGEDWWTKNLKSGESWMVVSARWDSDGVAATRSPDDLVGRGLSQGGEQQRVSIPLQGRGAFGKFATTKQ